MAIFTPLAMMAQETLTIYEDGTATSSNVPVHGTWADAYLKCEIVVPADQLESMNGGTISQMDFYLTSPAAEAWTGTFQVFLNEVGDATISDYYGTNGAAIVYEGTLDGTQSTMTVAFSDNYIYGGGNLLIGVYQIVKGNWKGATFAGATVTGASGQGYSSGSLDGISFSQKNFIPKTTFTYIPGGGVVCEKPESLEATNVTENGATLTWTGGSGNYNVEYKLASETEWTSFMTNTTSTTCNLTGLTPGKVYQARVQSVCGDATSGWKSVNFTTACGVITTFPWTETFESYASGNFEDPCWVNEHIEGSGTYVFKVSTSSNEGNTTHQLQLPDMAGGTLTKLVLPEMTLPANYEFSIDIYRSSSTYNDNYPNEGIRVYASTDGEIEGATELAFIPRHYQVSNDVIPAEGATGWYTYELPIGMSGTCYIILRGESQYCTSTFMDNLTVKAMPSCPTPTGLAVTANSVTAHNATITWTESGEASTWIVEFATDADFTDVLFETVEDTPTYTFVGLEPETTYYVRVKSHCGDDSESEFSNVVNFTTAIACPAPTGLTVNPGIYSATVNWDGTSESYIVSYRTAAYSEGIVEEFNNYGVPSGWTRYTGLVDYVLTDSIQLQTVTSGWGSNSYALGQYNMKLNIFGTSCRNWLVTPEFNLSQNLSFDLALTDYNNADPIENDTLQADDRFIVLIYANDAWHILREWNNSGSEYVYNAISYTGENVSIDLSAYYGQDVKIAFYGESTVSNNGDNDLHIDNVICGIPYEAGEWQTITTTETTATITDLNPETAYEVKVQGDCGELDGMSLETAIVTFTTLEGCPVPQNVEVNDITYNSATVTWDGYNDSYNVSYRMAAHADGLIEHFDVLGVPSGWTRYTGLVDYVLTDSIQLAPATGGWATNSYALGQYNMKLNIYGASYVKHWLVTPEFKPSQDLTFDLALTDYNNSDPIENDTLQADDRFIVLVYADDAWHILREWNNSGSEYVYNTISATGENVTIDLSAYYGKKVKIAFYGESTSSSDENAGDNDLHIDNIVCGTPVEAGEWETVEASESPVVLTGLTPETPYEVKVQGVCGGVATEWTNMVTFTTLEEPITYTLEINAYTGDNDNYYLIASPIGAIAANMVEGLRTPDFDFYSFNQSGTNGDGLEWINLRDDEVYELQPGVGYLYANNSGEDLTFNGTGITEGAYEMDLAYDSNAEDFPGWNLMGNPFCVAATSSMPYYRMQNGAFLPELQEGNIAPMEGFFVCATAENQKVTITPSNGNKGSMLALNLTESGKLVDRAIVSFGKEQQLPKLQLFSKSKVYIEQDNKDYAIVNAEEIGEMPVSFKAEKNGNYTISFSNENVEFGYLHLIDNMTGADIDLLETHSYSFDAKVTDYASRFKLVFATGNSDDNSFAFYNNGNIVISNEGNAILNIVDVLGRTISSQNINGSENVSINAKAGVYMLQLIQGEKVMTQKIVVE